MTTFRCSIKDLVLKFPYHLYAFYAIVGNAANPENKGIRELRE
ncbi:MAG: hypothetical protein WBL68_02415 [Nitrososphaeraceae archaeon]